MIKGNASGSKKKIDKTCMGMTGETSKRPLGSTESRKIGGNVDWGNKSRTWITFKTTVVEDKIVVSQVKLILINTETSPGRSLGL